MIGRQLEQRRVRRFWSWFAAEAQGLDYSLEALMRGEADATYALEALNARLRQADTTLSCDIARTLDGGCELRIEGPAASAARLLNCAPRIRGWRIVETAPDTDQRRAPYRVSPRPALDFLATPITGAHEAWA